MLTDHDIAQLMNAHSLQGGNNDSPWWLTFARAVERNAVKDAHSEATADAVRFRWLCRYPDWHFIERLCREFVADSNMEFLVELRRVIDARRSVELGPFDEHMPPDDLDWERKADSITRAALGGDVTRPINPNARSIDDL